METDDLNEERKIKNEELWIHIYYMMPMQATTLK